MYSKKELTLKKSVLKARREYLYKFIGQERQDELGLNWDSFRHRNYDYAIGRFMGIDPISETFPNQTTYQFASNNPVWKIEYEGLEGYPTTEDDWVNGLGYGVSDVNGGGVSHTGAYEPGLYETVTGAIGSFFGGIHDGISGAISDGVSAVMGTSEPSTVMSASEFSDAMASGDENAVFQGLEASAAGMYNAVPEIAGEVGAMLIEGAVAETIGGLKTTKSKPNYSNLAEPRNVGAGKKFTKAQKSRILRANKEANGGVLRSDKSGGALDNPVQSRKGVKANMNQAEVDHINAKSKGGTNSNRNAQVLSKRENIKKSNH